MNFQQALSGLNATSKSLEVIGNNIAIAGTYGSKASRAEFADFYAASLNDSSSTNTGIGTYLATIAQEFTQGSITATDNPLDLAVNGRGFFQVSDGVSPTKYTRNGQFKLDRDGFIVNNGGLKLMGYRADPISGKIEPGTAAPIRMPTGGIAPEATKKMAMELNLDAADKVTKPAAAPFIDFNDSDTYNNATSLTVYDVKGLPVALTYYFQRAAASGSGTPAAPADVWEVYITANGQTVAGTAAAPAPVITVPFVADGSMPDLAGVIPAGSTLDPVTKKMTVALPTPLNPGPDDSGNVPAPLTDLMLTLKVTQFAAPFGVTDLDKDGYPAGQLVAIGIEDNGIVTGRYSNGQAKNVGQIELATFRNLQGLQPLGDNLWASTYASGDPVTGVPGMGNLGVLQSGGLEESNVDLTAELVNMITAQRSYQANAQTIKTQDQILQTIVNLR